MDNPTKEQGKFLVRQARKYLESHLTGKEYKIDNNSEWLNRRHGIFVTLHTYPQNDLRGCIGFTESTYPLKKAITKATKAAALEDPRFPKVTKDELDHLIIEISILTPPKIIPHTNPKNLLERITQKKDGLILKTEDGQGLFLPQVWEQLPKKIEFLENLCYKAGLFDKDAWQYKDTEIHKFRVQIFKESTPDDEIIEAKE